ncbi:bifunctional DNA primase/polymerase [Labedaea rhizosphaerae]|uniref:Bifunctional DNA primase/polymerase-like protein n=1 Tax=Labedaea rhizosphaerae TaxID=598644 RepID=A0A4R6SGH9_LABRH|nr:bifunctional DNA primase/polymerase [Labedaea rhizosphaerae]TDQ00620.1 bifunctional DNA primase/polymerase-like protein [Labedaea rhizosphaerae]
MNSPSSPANPAEHRETLLCAALAAADAGHFVFPLAPMSKKPAFRRWQGAATRSGDLIREQWARRPFNIGIACEPSGLYVIDLDDGHGHQPPPGSEGAAHGRDVLTRLAAAAGEPYPSDTFTVTTPTNGEHLYFAMPAGHAKLRNTVGRLGWRIDTRGIGGYVVAAGSVRPGGSYVVTNNASITRLPQWLLAKLTTQPLDEPGRIPLPHAAPIQRMDAYVAHVAHNVRHAEPGTRHHTLNLAAYTLGRLVGGGELPHHQAVAVLNEAAAAHLGVDEWTLAEAKRTIHDGLAAGIKHPRELSSQPTTRPESHQRHRSTKERHR